MIRIQSAHLAVVLMLASMSDIPAQLPPNIENLYKEANKSFESKDFTRASELLQRAANQAEQATAGDQYSPTHELRAGVVIRQAQVLMQDALNKDKLERSLALFQQVAASNELGSPKQKAISQVNAGAVLMQLKRPREAAELMAKCDWDQIDPAQKHVLYYNYALALESSDQPREAIVGYSRSLFHEPEFQPSAQRLNRLAAELVSQDPSQTLALGRSMAQEGAPGPAVQFATEILQRGDASTAQVLDAMQVLLLAWTDTYVDPDQFAAQQSRTLRALADSQWKPFSDEVRLAASHDFIKVSAQNDYHGSLNSKLTSLPWTTNNNRSQLYQPLATFLAATARPYLQSAAAAEEATGQIDPTGQAFARIYSAWLIAPRDLELSRQLAALTQNNEKQVDSIRATARQRLIESMVSAKGEMYQLRGKTTRDWENILLMHTALGTIFEADEVWGNEDSVRSAIGQWSYAINAENQIRALQPEAEFRAPGLHEHLANCLKAKGEWAAAFNSYIEAGMGYLKLENVRSAKRMEESARIIEFPRPASAQAKLQSLQDALSLLNPAR